MSSSTSSYLHARTGRQFSLDGCTDTFEVAITPRNAEQRSPSKVQSRRELMNAAHRWRRVQSISKVPINVGFRSSRWLPRAPNRLIAASTSALSRPLRSHRVNSFLNFIEPSLSKNSSRIRPIFLYIIICFVYSFFLFLLIDPFDVLVSSIGRSSVFGLGRAICCIWFDK